MCRISKNYRYAVYDEDETLVFESGSTNDVAKYLSINLATLYASIERKTKIDNKYSIEKYLDISDDEYETFIHGGVLA